MTSSARATAPYGRTIGSILAFLVVALFVKFADLLLTYELQFDPPGFLSRVSQVWMALRFAWQEFAMVALLFAIVVVWQVRVPSPGRPTRAMLAALRMALILGALVSVAGIKYYGMYHGHMMITDFAENILWAFQIAGSVKVFESASIKLGAALGALFLLGTPWVCARLSPDRAMRLGARAFVLTRLR